MKILKTLVFLGLVAIVSLSVYRSISNLASSRDRVRLAEKHLEESRQKQEELKEELSRVTSDFYKEKQARDKLGLARDSDVVIVLPGEDLLRRLSPRIAIQEDIKLPEPNWKKWIGLFFDI